MDSILIIAGIILFLFSIGHLSEKRRIRKKEEARAERRRLREKTNEEKSVEHFEECRQRAAQENLRREMDEARKMEEQAAKDLRHAKSDIAKDVKAMSDDIISEIKKTDKAKGNIKKDKNNHHKDDAPIKESSSNKNTQDNVGMMNQSTIEDNCFETVMEYINRSKCIQTGNRYEVYIKPYGQVPGPPAYVKYFNEAIEFAEDLSQGSQERTGSNVAWWVRNAETDEIVAAGGISAKGKPFRFYRQDKIDAFYSEKLAEKLINYDVKITYTKNDNRFDGASAFDSQPGGEQKIRDVKVDGIMTGGVFIGDGIDRDIDEVEDALRRRFQEPDYAISIFKKYAENEFGVAYKHEICKILRDGKRYEEELPIIDQILHRIRTISYGEASDYVVEYIMSKEELFERRRDYVMRVISNKNKRK